MRDRAAPDSHDQTGPVVECTGVNHRYGTGNATSILRSIDFKINTGEFVSIVGASGCGKTTLLRVVGGLLQPSRGTVKVNGRIVAGEPDAESAFVFQNDRLYPWRSAIRNVGFGLELQHIPKREVRSRSMEALDLVGLAEYADFFPAELSGGMRQRINIARALAVRPTVLLMDEPFAALDAQTRELMQRELLAILGKTRLSVLFVTHQIEEAIYLSDRVLVLSAEGPSTVRRVVNVPLERPRDLSVKRSREFQDMHDTIWHEIEQDVTKSFLN